MPHSYPIPARPTAARAARLTPYPRGGVIRSAAAAVLLASSLCLSAAFNAPVLAGIDAVWVQIPAPANNPPGLYEPSLTLDPSRRRAIAYGSVAPPYDLWSMTLDGPVVWTRLVPQGALPPRADLPAAVYDAAADRLVVYGGYGSDMKVRALALGGSMTWSELTPLGTGPGPRYEHLSVFDAARRRMILFGGWDASAPTNSVWALDLDDPVTWIPLTPASGAAPTPRSGLAGIVDPVRDRLVIYGGFDNTLSFPYSVWALPLSGSGGWQLLDAAGPGGTFNQGRRYHTAIYDPVGDRMIVHGGSGSGDTPKSETWSFSLGTNTWTQLTAAGTAPPKRLHGALYDPDQQRMIVYGGSTPQEAWSLSLGGSPSWTRLSPPATPAWPGPRMLASSVYVPTLDRVYMFAGWGTFISQYNDVWRLRPRPEPLWSRVNTLTGPPLFQPPSVRRGAGLVNDTARDQLVVVGGVANRGVPIDAWTLRLSDGLWTRLQPAGTAPEAREGAAVIYDPIRDRVLMFSGETSDTQYGHTLDGLWELTLGPSPAWTQLSPAGRPPLSRSLCTSFYDPVRDRLVILGGRYKTGLSSQDLDDVWALDLAGTLTWTQLPVSPPTPGGQYCQAGAYDPLRDRVVLCSSIQGGVSPWTYSPVWELSMQTLTWSPVSTFGGPPIHRFAAAASWDPLGDQMLVFGGNGVALFDETWALQFIDPATAVSPEVPIGSGLALGAAYPSPTSGAAYVPVRLPDGAPARLEVWDVAGRRRLAHDLGDLGPGSHVVRLDAARTLPAGLYWARLVHASGVRTARFAIVR